MGRRQKEEASTHRNRIADAAEVLFLEKGIAGTTMKEVADKAGYSKATLYVYFMDKEQLVNYLTLRSMLKLKHVLEDGVRGKISYEEKFMAICHAVWNYARKYPLYFELDLETIKLDANVGYFEESERDIYIVGEQINEWMVDCYEEGVAQGIFQKCENARARIFLIWSMLSGLIRTAIKKQEYLNGEIGVETMAFLEEGFLGIWKMIKEKN